MIEDDIIGVAQASLGASAKVFVRPDSFRGSRVAVILPDNDLENQARGYDKLEAALASFDIARIQVFSRSEALVVIGDEASWDSEFGGASADNVPLWPESLLRGQEKNITLNLPSLNDIPLSGPIFSTFYSLRGGVGRSTALAHTAMLLSKKHKVLCIDMDLEAPGLASLFDVEDQVQDGQGVVSVLLKGEIAGRVDDLDDHVIPVNSTSSIYLLPAGRPGADYARKLAQLDPAAWYREASNPLRQMIDQIRTMRLDPDIVLIDARTGISPLSAPLLFDVADVAIICLFPHPQARFGTAALTRALLGSETYRSVDRSSGITPEPRFVVSPIPGASSPEVRQFYVDRSIEWIREWLAPAQDANGEPVFDDVEELLHVVGYSEEIAASDSVSTRTESSYAPIAGWIAGFVNELDYDDSLGESDLAPTLKSSLLSEIRFSTGTAEAQSDEDFEESFLTTDNVERAMRPDVPLILGRKGTGKTALFRRLAQSSQATVVTSPPGLPTHQSWMLEAESFRAVGDTLASQDRDWRGFWPVLCGLVLRLENPDLPSPDWVSEPLAFTQSLADYSNLQLVSDIRIMLSHPDATLHAVQWVRDIDDALTSRAVLLFDGLDTGFGLERADLVRRQQGIGGLLSFLMTHDDGLKNITFKVMLREDIWRLISVANKSHFYGREVRLAWSDQTDYLRVALKQALRSPAFSNYVESTLSRPGLELGRLSVEYWPEGLVYDAWTLLVGERVSGGKTAFTYNWVWSRLSDANENHSPRALLQLFHEAVQLEGRLQRTNPYERSVLRPRALVESLDEVSEQAITALREEFRELEPLFINLEGVGRTPFDASELDVDAAVETLAREVGLLGVDLGTRDDVERYRVPELYRKALNMGRRGQA